MLSRPNSCRSRPGGTGPARWQLPRSGCRIAHGPPRPEMTGTVSGKWKVTYEVVTVTSCPAEAERSVPRSAHRNFSDPNGVVDGTKNRMAKVTLAPGGTVPTGPQLSWYATS